MLKLLLRQFIAQLRFGLKINSTPAIAPKLWPEMRPLIGPTIWIAAIVGLSTPVFADCRFSSTPFPTITSVTLDPSGLGLNGGAFIHHGNVMAAGHIDNLLLYHVGDEIIPEVSNIVYAKLSSDRQNAIYTFPDHSSIRVSLNGVTTVPYSQQNVPATYSSPSGLGRRLYLICQ